MAVVEQRDRKEEESAVVGRVEGTEEVGDRSGEKKIMDE